MGRKEYKGVLKVASQQIPCRIYAVEKDGICELRNDTFDSKEELKKAVAEYTAKEFERKLTELEKASIRNQVAIIKFDMPETKDLEKFGICLGGLMYGKQ